MFLRNPHWKRALIIIALASAYYFLVGLISEELPFVNLPEWLKQSSPSSSFALTIWFAALCAVSAFSAAIPVAAIIVWAARVGAIPLAFGVSAIVAIAVLGLAWIDYGAPGTLARWVSDIVYLLSLLLAVPFWTGLIARVTHQSLQTRSHA